MKHSAQREEGELLKICFSARTHEHRGCSAPWTSPLRAVMSLLWALQSLEGIFFRWISPVLVPQQQKETDRLTIRCLFSKYCILAVEKSANAREVAIAMVEKFIC